MKEPSLLLFTRHGDKRALGDPYYASLKSDGPIPAYGDIVTLHDGVVYDVVGRAFDFSKENQLAGAAAVIIYILVPNQDLPPPAADK